MSAQNDTTVPEAAPAFRGDTRHAVRALRLLYGRRYAFGYDQERRVFWAIRDGLIGSLVTAPTPLALSGLLDNALVAVS